MSTEIIFAAALWLVITIFSPGKMRAFISLLSAGLIFVLLFFSFISPRDPVVSVPSFKDSEGYELPYEDFKALAAGKKLSGVVEFADAEALANSGKDIFTHKDLTPEQLKALESHPSYSDIKSGKMGIVPHFVPATVQEGKLVPGYYGIEIAPLPYFDDLKRKTEVLDAIRDIVNGQPSQM